MTDSSTFHLLPSETSLLTLSAPPTGSSAILESACSAKPEVALSSDFARSLFRLERRKDGKVEAGIKLDGVDSEQKEEDLLAIGVAALHAYAQVNWVGPSLDLSPLSLFNSDSSNDSITEQELNDTAIDALAFAGEPLYHLSKKTTFLYLALQIFGLVPSPFSSSSSSSSSAPPPSPTLLKPSGHEWKLESIKIWRLRAGIMWLKVLDEPVPLPSFVANEAHQLRLLLPSSDSPIRSSLTLSLSILSTLLSRASPHSSAQKEASNLARSAAEEVGLEWESTGRKGKRTKWQVDEKTQLVVLARDRSGTTKGKGKEIEPASEKKEEDDAVKLPENFALNDDTLLERTAFTPVSTDGAGSDLSSLDPSEQPPLSPFSQSILLSLALATLPAPTSLMNLSADVLSTSQISSFVARVLLDSQNWSVHSMALLLRCRAEAGRSRTVERGVLQMQALVDQLKDGSPTEVSAISSAVKSQDMAEARDRLVQFHSLALPPAWEMEKELAVRYMSLGIVKSALEIFTRLEMWEEVARCWMTLERPDRGVEIIKELLEGGKSESDVVMNERKGDGARVFKGGEKYEAKLWCTLGELEREPKHYERAWEVSGKSSSRAQRSLGAVYYSRNEYEKARTSLRLALAINPLFPRTWFMLGCCEMRLEDWAGAQESFGRAVGLENDDAQSWSNLASCHLRRGEVEGDVDEEEDLDDLDEGLDSTGTRITEKKEEETQTEDEKLARVKLPFSRKRAAYQCLRQSIKYSYDSWRLWYNYMVVAVDVGEMSEACRSLDRIIGMRINKDGEGAIDFEVLERLVDAVTRGQEDVNEDGEVVTIDPNVGRGLFPRVERLINTTILPNVSNSPRVFLAQARLCLWQRDYAGALDAHLKAYRSLVVGNESIEHDKAKFIEATERVEEVVEMLENLGTKDGKDGEMIAKDWKFQARSLVRTFLGRTKGAFEDEPQYEKLKELLAELR
ncbi:tetratricopeptide repeat-containing protein EMW1 [Sporobolomyces salmoneus]|uniref:tetratricopeptide repeat-containing protein EMW1 n=1 Tax=Sporobolomyces salmoneus TaxID=183962 RepID=UPI003176FED8